MAPSTAALLGSRLLGTTLTAAGGSLGLVLLSGHLRVRDSVCNERTGLNDRKESWVVERSQPFLNLGCSSSREGGTFTRRLPDEKKKKIKKKASPVTSLTSWENKDEVRCEGEKTRTCVGGSWRE